MSFYTVKTSVMSNYLNMDFIKKKNHLHLFTLKKKDMSKQ